MCEQLSLLGFYRKVIARAFSGQPIPEGPHPLEDDELVASFENNLLSETERQKLVDHIAICPRCRDKLVALIRSETDSPGGDATPL